MVDVNVKGINHLQQKLGYSCGWVSTRQVLLYRGYQDTMDAFFEDEGITTKKERERILKIPHLIQLSHELYPNFNPKNGLHVNAMKKLGEYFGFQTTHLDWCEHEDLYTLVAEYEIPVIVDWYQGAPLGQSEGHYSICIGVDETGVKLVDPSYKGHREINWDDFERNWMDNRKNTIVSLDKIEEMRYRRLVVIAPKIPRDIPYHQPHRQAQRLEARIKLAEQVLKKAQTELKQFSRKKKNREYLGKEKISELKKRLDSISKFKP